MIPFESTQWIISLEWYTTFVIAILSAALVVGAFTLFMVYKIVRARRLKPAVGKLLGDTVEVMDEIEPGAVGYVKYRGEYWRAKSNKFLQQGDSARIIAKEGPILTVSPSEENPSSS